MSIIKNVSVRTCSRSTAPHSVAVAGNLGQALKRAILPSFLPISMIMLWLLSCLYSASVLAHDPGLSMVDIELNNNKISAHITYAKRDIEQFINLDYTSKPGDSTELTAQTRAELTEFIIKAIEFSSNNKKINAAITDIHLDNSDAIHFLLTLSSLSGQELTIHSRVIDQFPLGHRQFVKVKTAQGLINSHLLSAREPSYTSNLPEVNGLGIFNNFLLEGIWHIWIGFDHILFVVTLLLPAVLVYRGSGWHPNHDFKQIFKFTVKVISAFTIAHSLTLGLTVFELITLPGKLVESMIAASIIVAAANNIYAWVYERLWLVAFAFGLIHGMGFASVLNEIGMQSNTQAWALTGFNCGVEIGQLAIVTALLPLLYLFRKRTFYKPYIFQSGSYLVAIVASIWLFERLTNTSVIQYLS